MKIYEILKDENVGKIYFDNLINETWIIHEVVTIGMDEIELSLETLENEENIKDFFNLTMQEILEMNFEETEEE